MPPALNLPPPRMPPAASNIPPPPPLVSNVGRATQPPRRVGLHLLPWVIAVATFGFVGALGYLDERGLETDLRGAVRAFTTSLVVRARP